MIFSDACVLKHIFCIKISSKMILLSSRDRILLVGRPVLRYQCNLFADLLCLLYKGKRSIDTGLNYVIETSILISDV